jgi:hypothetical protein
MDVTELVDGPSDLRGELEGIEGGRRGASGLVGGHRLAAELSRDGRQG